MTRPRTVTSWVTANGTRLVLVHLVSTSRNRDGWHLIVASPTGTLLADWHFGRDVDEPELARALAAVDAVPVLPAKTKEGTTQP